MQSYPIWNVLHGLPYKTSKDFGAREDGYSMNIYVGTSASNSHEFADIVVHRSDDGKTFTLYVNGQEVRRMEFDENWQEVA